MKLPIWHERQQSEIIIGIKAKKTITQTNYAEGEAVHENT